MTNLVALLFLCLPLLTFGGSCPGICESTANSCSSGYEAGLCPGPANIECCPMPTPSCNGQCQDNSLPCSGSYKAGECPGPNNIQCCTSSGPPPPPPPPGGTCRQFADQEWNCADVSCSSHVCTGCGQPNYQCAEFVARVLASGGLIPLSPTAPQSSYEYFHANGRTYDLLWVSSKNGGITGLDDYLGDSGWTSCGGYNTCVTECSALIVVGADGPYSHAVAGVGLELCDAHNVARYHVPPSIYSLDNVWNPPKNIQEIVAKQRAERAALGLTDGSDLVDNRTSHTPHYKPF